MACPECGSLSARMHTAEGRTVGTCLTCDTVWAVDTNGEIWVMRRKKGSNGSGVDHGKNPEERREGLEDGPGAESLWAAIRRRNSSAMLRAGVLVTESVELVMIARETRRETIELLAAR